MSHSPSLATPGTGRPHDEAEARRAPRLPPLPPHLRPSPAPVIQKLSTAAPATQRVPNVQPPAAPTSPSSSTRGRQTSTDASIPAAPRTKAPRWLSWTLTAVAVVAVVIGVGIWLLFQRDSRGDQAEVAKLKNELAALAQQTAEMKAALEAAKASPPAAEAPAAKAQAQVPAEGVAPSHLAQLLAVENLGLLQEVFPTSQLPALLDQLMHASATGDAAAISRVREQFRRLQFPKPGLEADARALDQEGQAHMAKSEAELAAARFSESALINPADAAVMDRFAQALAAMGELQKASSASLLALSLAPTRGSTWETMATTFARMDGGASPRAVLMLQNAYRFADNPDAAKERITLLGQEGAEGPQRQLAAAVLPTLATIPPVSLK